MSLFRILLDQISKALRGENTPLTPCGGACSDTGNSSTSVCHNPEHISDWHAHEVHEYHALSSGKECSWIVPLAGNAFLSNTNSSDEERIPICNSNLITPSGLRNWNDEGVKVSLFFHCVQPGEYLVALRLHVPNKHSSKIRVSIKSCTNRASSCQTPVIYEINVKGKGDGKLHQLVSCGNFNVSQVGYIQMDLIGIQRSGKVYADISHAILIPDSDISSRQKRSLSPYAPTSSSDQSDHTSLEKNNLKFVSDPEDFYFGRRGPSVHLNYQVPSYSNGNCEVPRKIEYFYNEVMVPQGQDVIGSYFCAIGFSGGYFGMQVNSSTERRILFSIWSAYNCENPQDIPKDFKVTLLKKGESTHVGEFGNEGSGAQSYLRYSWESNKVYKFLVHAKPIDEEHTMYSAWFMEGDNDWRLIASFKKPKVSTWLQGLYSFSENFIPEMGHVERYCTFGNQWAWDVDRNEWVEVTRAKFTADATASKGSRADVAGGVIKTEGDWGTGTSKFYLRNCGFFSDSEEPGKMLYRDACHNFYPNVDFRKL